MGDVFCPAPPVKLRGVSDRYVTIDTRYVRDELERWGWQHVSTDFPRRNPWGKHLLRFEHPEVADPGEGTPQILLWNSYNGTYSLKMRTGFFRFVCSNGLVLGRTIDSSRIRHVGEPAKSWLSTVAAALRDVDYALPRVRQMREREMREIEILDFGARALSLRFGIDPADPEIPLMSSMVAATEAHRPEDVGNDLWRVFNRTQENLLHGGFHSPKSGRRTIHLNPRAKVEFNARLFQDVAMTYLS